MSELKPCPFCGATDSRLVQAFTRATDDFAYWSVECLDCGVEVADDESQEAADRAWNRRTLPAAASVEAGERAQIVAIIRDVIRSFQDCDGDEVAAQVGFRLDAIERGDHLAAKEATDGE